MHEFIATLMDGLLDLFTGSMGNYLWMIATVFFITQVYRWLLAPLFGHTGRSDSNRGYRKKQKNNSEGT